jgi:hypothetical protein
MDCPRCDRRAVITITLKIGQRDVSFFRCTHCDLQTWRTEDGSMSLDGVLELARTASAK